MSTKTTPLMAVYAAANSLDSETELVRVELENGIATIVLDDGTPIRFDADELRDAIAA